MPQSLSISSKENSRNKLILEILLVLFSVRRESKTTLNCITCNRLQNVPNLSCLLCGYWLTYHKKIDQIHSAIHCASCRGPIYRARCYHSIHYHTPVVTKPVMLASHNTSMPHHITSHISHNNCASCRGLIGARR